MGTLSLRDDILKFVLDYYGTKPDYPWVKYSENAVLRHEKSRKWYGVIMPVKREKLGLSGEDEIDVLNLRLDPLLIGSLLESGGFVKAYHMNKINWISVLLDGSVPLEEIKPLIEMSFSLTKSNGGTIKNKK